MKTLLFALPIFTIACMSTVAHADDDAHPLRIGFGADVGVPSGAALGVIIHPKEDWLTAEASLTHNVLNFGGRLSLKLDPMALAKNLPIGVFVDVQGGFAGAGNVPGHSDLPSVGYDYVNLYGGLRFGKPNGFNWNLEMGPSYMHVSTGNFSSVVNTTGVTLGNPQANLWIAPAFSTGFSVVWP